MKITKYVAFHTSTNGNGTISPGNFREIIEKSSLESVFKKAYPNIYDDIMNYHGETFTEKLQNIVEYELQVASTPHFHKIKELENTDQISHVIDNIHLTSLYGANKIMNKRKAAVFNLVTEEHNLLHLNWGMYATLPTRKHLNIQVKSYESKDFAFFNICNLDDLPSSEEKKKMKTTINYLLPIIKQYEDRGFEIYINCWRGMSRSATLLLVYLHRHKNIDFSAYEHEEYINIKLHSLKKYDNVSYFPLLKFLLNKRLCVNQNIGFIDLCCELIKIL